MGNKTSKGPNGVQNGQALPSQRIEFQAGNVPPNSSTPATTNVPTSISHESGRVADPLPVTRRGALDDFVLLKTVGKGSFGKVVMVCIFVTPLPC